MTKLWAMRGYSGSGKSTKAKEIARETGAVIVNRDQLRLMLLGEWWTGKKDDEDRVTVAEEAQVSALLESNTPVVVDATHLHPPYLRKWARLATRMGVDFEVVDVRTGLASCLMNDLTRERVVGSSVIRKQADRWPMHKWPTVTAEKVEIEPYIPPKDGYQAIIVDIDGTLAHIPDGGRSPYDYTQVDKDVIDKDVRLVVNTVGRSVDQVIVLSGRDDTCYQDTFDWLVTNQVRFDRLIMRPAGATDERGNKLPDWIVKLNLFNKYLRDYYDVRFVLDDRQQVVDMWRKLGLKCLQVAPGDF